MEYTILLTTECNFNCAYCYENFKNAGEKWMNQEVLKKTIDFIFNRKGDGRYYINFFGGEPILAIKNIYYAVDYIKNNYSSKGIINYSINTNGSNIDDELIDFFECNNFNVKISIDGDQYCHNLNRKTKSEIDLYGEILKNALTINSRRINNTIRMTVTQNTISHLFENIKYLYELGFKNINIGMDYSCNYNDNDLEIFRVNMENIADFYINELKQNKVIIINYFNGQFSKFVFDYGNQFIMCGGGIESLRFMPNGDIYPCNAVCGNIQFCIGDIYSEASIGKAMKMVYKNVSQSNKCKDCDIAFFCHYMKCGYINYLNTGFFNIPSELDCKFQKTLYPIVNRVFEYILHEKRQLIQVYIDHAIKNNEKIRYQ